MPFLWSFPFFVGDLKCNPKQNIIWYTSGGCDGRSFPEDMSDVGTNIVQGLEV